MKGILIMTNEKRNDLIERYIYAATRRLPARQRDDVAQELRTVISDMLTERCGDAVPQEKDIRVVLTELGTPNELAEKYSTDKVNCLIGSPHYLTYKFVASIVVAAASLGVAFALILSHILEPEYTWYAFIGEWLGAIWSTGLQAFAIVTIVFAVLHRKGVSVDGTKSLDELPSVPKKSEKINRIECCIDIALTVAFTSVLIFAPQILTGFASVSDGGEVLALNLFDLDVLASIVPLLVAIAVVGIGREIVKLIEGRYSKLTAIVITAANIAQIGFSAAILTKNGLFNSEINAYIPNDVSFSMMSLQYFVLAIIALAMSIEIAKAIYISIKNS